MLRRDLADRLSRSGDDDAVVPDYGGYCFAGVPDALCGLAAGEDDQGLPADVWTGIDVERPRTVCLLLDGFGWSQWVREHRRNPLLEAVTEAGPVTPLTSVYPSETAAAMTTFASGIQPIEHGVLGWWQYEPDLDAVITTLPFRTLDDRPVGEVYDSTRADILPSARTYERLGENGRTVLALPETFAETTATRIRTGNVDVRGCGDSAAMARTIRTALVDGARTVYGYSPVLDTVGHHSGPDGPRYREALDGLTSALTRELEAVPDRIAAETVLVLTADHGQVSTPSPDNRDLRELGIWDALRTDATGSPIPPVGSPRNVRLHVAPGERERVAATLEESIDARVLTREEAVGQELFGDRPPGPGFAGRCGDLVCIPRRASAWWMREELGLAGMHGGLDADEMLVPFAAAPLDRI